MNISSNELSLPDLVPNHFLDEEIQTALSVILKLNGDKSDVQFIYDDSLFSSLAHKTYNLTCGLLTKLRNNVDRLKKRSLIRYYEKLTTFSISKLLFHLLLYFITEHNNNDSSRAIQISLLNDTVQPEQLKDGEKASVFSSNVDFESWNQKSYLLTHWDDVTLFEASEELICKGINLSAKLLKELHEQPLIRNVHATSIWIRKRQLQQQQSTGYTNEQELICPVTINIDQDDDLKYEEITQSLVVFPNSDFLRRVHEYHQTMTRPVAAFTLGDINASGLSATIDITATAGNDGIPPNDISSKNNNHNDCDMSEHHTQLPQETQQAQQESYDMEQIKRLAALPRDTCAGCNCKRQVYCGDCGSSGERMSNASGLLPPRVTLPFNILLLVHWHESLHKCTGVHAAVLAERGSVECVQWGREDAAVTAAAADSPSPTTAASNSSSSSAHTNRPAPSPPSQPLSSSSYASSSSSSPSPSANKEDKQKGKKYNSNLLRSKAADGRLPAWADVVLSLSAESDVLLYPADEHAVDAHCFPWRQRRPHIHPYTHQLLSQTMNDENDNSCSSSDTSNNSHISSSSSSISCSGKGSSGNNIACSSRGGDDSSKWRVVVLEASWQHAKTMFSKIAALRARHSLPPLPCVKLCDITGQYWRFQENGHSAVSTIEALAYTASAAAAALHTTTDNTVTDPATATVTDTVATMDTETTPMPIMSTAAVSNTPELNVAHVSNEAAVIFNVLLTLFRLQKYRVLTRVFVEGGRPPKAIRVTGVGLGSWLPLTSQFSDGSGSRLMAATHQSVQ